MAIGDGLGRLTAKVGLDTSELSPAVAKAKSELAGVGTTATKVGTDVKSVGSIIKSGFDDATKSLAGMGVGTSALSGHISTLKGAVGDARGAMSSMAGEGNLLKTAMTGVGVGIAGVGVAIAGLAVDGIGKFLSAAGQVRSLQATLGSTSEEASKLRNVAIGLGVDVDTMGKALFKLGPILQANKGDLAGVHVEMAKNADGSTNLIGTLGNMRTAYQGLTDPIQKAQFLQEAFKKTGLDLRPILSATADQFNRLANTGPIFKQADLDKAKELSTAQRELKQRVDDLEISLAEKLAPALDRVAQLTDKNVGAGNEFKRVGLDVVRMATGQWSELGKLDSAHQRLYDAQKKSAGSAEDAREAQSQLTAAIEAQTRAADNLATAQERNLDAGLALERAQSGLATATAAAATAHNDAAAAVRQYGAGSDEATAAGKRATDADESLSDAAIAVAKATRDKEVAEREAAGTSVSASEKVNLLKAALIQQADTIGGPVGDALRGYAGQLRDLPSDVTTTIHTLGITDAGDALDGLRGKLRALDGTSATVYTNHVDVYHDDISHSPAAPSGSAVGNILGPQGIVKLAGGGRTAGFITKGPRFLVGEGNPAYPEGVIATDPMYHDRNVRIWKWAGAQLGMFASGGTTGAASIDYDRLGAAVAAALAATHDGLGAAVAAAVSANPVRAVVSANDVQAGTYASSRGRR